MRANRRGSLSGLALAIALCASARADVAPPAGLAWLEQKRLMLENTEAFPDYAFVVVPCFGNEPLRGTPEPYCVMRPGRELPPAGELYAIRARDLPEKIADAKAFFAKDPRVVRPGHSLSRVDTAPKDSGIRGATYFVHVDRVGEKGVEAHFSRAAYECVNGAKVAVGWGNDQKTPPAALCPATDDDGQIIPLADGGPEKPGATSRPSPPSVEPGSPLGGRSIRWLGALVAGVSLIGGGLLLRPKKS